MANEKEIESYLVKRFKQEGGSAIKFTSSGTWGIPDRLCLLPGTRVAFAEMKSTGRKPTERQQRWINTLKKLGFVAVVIDSKPKVDALIKFMWEKLP